MLHFDRENCIHLNADERLILECLPSRKVPQSLNEFSTWCLRFLAHSDLPDSVQRRIKANIVRTWTHLCMATNGRVDREILICA